MLANVGVELLGGSVPIAGDLFDMALKANLRNLAIIEAHLRPPRRGAAPGGRWTNTAGR
jgi:hypothetical protein